MVLNKKHRAIVLEIWTRLNARRMDKGRPAVAITKIPACPGSPSRYYLVDNFNVRRHWRRKPAGWK